MKRRVSQIFGFPTLRSAIRGWRANRGSISCSRELRSRVSDPAWPQGRITHWVGCLLNQYLCEPDREITDKGTMKGIRRIVLGVWGILEVSSAPHPHRRPPGMVRPSSPISAPRATPRPRHDNNGTVSRAARRERRREVWGADKSLKTSNRRKGQIFIGPSAEFSKRTLNECHLKGRMKITGFCRPFWKKLGPRCAIKQACQFGDWRVVGLLLSWCCCVGFGKVWGKYTKSVDTKRTSYPSSK